jgi:hypothetical protein
MTTAYEQNQSPQVLALGNGFLAQEAARLPQFPVRGILPVGKIPLGKYRHQAEQRQKRRMRPF